MSTLWGTECRCLIVLSGLKGEGAENLMHVLYVQVHVRFGLKLTKETGSSLPG